MHNTRHEWHNQTLNASLTDVTTKMFPHYRYHHLGIFLTRKSSTHTLPKKCGKSCTVNFFHHGNFAATPKQHPLYT